MEEKFIKILNKKDCTGCRACEQICPVKAISMKEDDEGFITPKVLLIYLLLKLQIDFIIKII